MSLCGTQPGKEDPSLPHGEGLSDSLPSSASCMSHHIDGMAGGQLNE